MHSNLEQKFAGTILLLSGGSLFSFAAVMIFAFQQLAGGQPIVAAASPAFQTAEWIAPPGTTDPLVALPLFRKEFSIEAKPRRATLRIVGLGDYDARVNGHRLAETGINQPWSQYEKTIYYREFDIAPFVLRGANCVGVMLANSFWHNPNPPKGRYNKAGPERTAAEPLLLGAEVVLEQKDGSIRRIGTDITWRSTSGPIAFSHVYAGEDYDACHEFPGWDRPGFDDRNWSAVRPATAPTATLARQDWPPFNGFACFSPQTIKEPATNVFLYTFLQNCSAQLQVEIEGGHAGDRIQFRCGEHKNVQNLLFGGYVVGCDLITNGKRLEHQWVSFYLGMQFVEVTGAVPKGHPNPRGLPVIRSLQLVHVRAGLPEAGSFTCSSELFNRTHNLIDWAMQNNTSHVLTDCPHREKLGWLECSYLLAPSFEYRYDCRGWFDKIERDIRDAQEPSGRVLTVAPSYPAGRFPGAFNWTVEWGAAAVLLPWEHYKWSGDPQVLRNNFDMMRRFTDCIQAEAKDGLAPGGLGDWYDYGHGQPPGPSRFTPTQLSATAAWAMCAQAVSKAAEVLSRTNEAREYRELHARIAVDFQRHFRDPTTGKLKHLGSPQCANAMALCAEVVPSTDRAMLVEDIIADLQQRGWQQTPGDIGHVYFIRALAQAGRSDLLHRVYSRDGTGSYGGILKKGLTALPETWDAMMDGYQSLDHCMLGHVMEWFYGYVAGIRQAPGSVGWTNILIAPNPGPLTHAEARLKTPMGPVLSRWSIQSGRFSLETEIPKGVHATALLPSGNTRELHPGSQTITEHQERPY
jgi:alpha-L-rhamnosidase